MEDFEILENGAQQSIQTFEHILVSPAGPQSLRAEPNSVRSAERMAADPRNRVFVFFLDTSHVALDSGHRVNEPLIQLMDRVLGPDDLVAVMTAEMSAAQITFGRKTEVIADMLRDRWHWGQRHGLMPHSDRELEYEACYPAKDQEPLVAEMRARRRERIVLDALHDLARYLGGIREERKAILTVSEGWTLFRPNPGMLRLRPSDSIPGTEPIGVDPWGRLRAGGDRDRSGNPASMTSCDRERMFLANIDNERHFRDLLDVANRNNASFYPIDPRGLAVFDYPIGPTPPPPMAADTSSLKQRIEVLRTLAENTDGLAVVNTNDLDGAMKRVADDLTSYYLLGYYSTNPKLDGGYRRLTVRVKRPGVDVRARRGYRAATMAEVNASSTAAPAPVADAIKTTNAALATLSRIRPAQRFSVHAIPVRDTSGGIVTGLWIAGELQMPLQEFAGGATADIDLSGATAAASAVLKPGERAFLIRVPIRNAAETIDVRARLSPAGGSAEPLTGGARVDPGAESVQPLAYRRGPSTGNRLQPAADFRFSRTERLRLELPIGADVTPGGGRFLDRNAQPLPVPVQLSERQDPEGQRWLSADATLSALGAGDYVIEVSYTTAGVERQILTAIRVTR